MSAKSVDAMIHCSLCGGEGHKSNNCPCIKKPYGRFVEQYIVMAKAHIRIVKDLIKSEKKSMTEVFETVNDICARERRIIGKELKRLCDDLTFEKEEEKLERKREMERNVNNLMNLMDGVRLETEKSGGTDETTTEDDDTMALPAKIARREPSATIKMARRS